MKTKVFLTTTNNFVRVYMLVALMLYSINSISAQGLVIVKENSAEASIVVSPVADSQIVHAAKFLQNIIQKSTGAFLPIITSPSKNTKAINVGKTNFVKAKKIDLSKVDEDGFLLQKADRNNFIIVGGSNWGTEFGVYAFLERFLGVVDLMPTDIGMDIPLHASVILPDVKIIDNPIYLSRQMAPISIGPNYPEGNWGRFNRLRGRIFFHHNLLNLFDPNEYFKTNPDFYPQENDKKEMPTGYKWQPNFSAKGIADSASEKIIRYFKQHPEIASYSLGINDYATFDQSKASLSRRKGTKNYLGFEDVSDDYFQWANDVVKKVTQVFPNKLFGLLAYNNVAEPPSPAIGIHPSIVPFITYERMRWADSTLERKGHELNKAWAEEAKVVGWYDYTYGLNYLIPRVWFHEMQDYLIWGTKHNVKYYYAESYPNWGEGPKSWVQSKLLWNPYSNVDSLLNVWYVRTAGNKASTYLKQFYAVWEKFWTKDIYSSKWNTNKRQWLPFTNIAYLNDVPVDYIDRCDSLMNAAYNYAKTPIQKLRVSKLRDMWQLYKTATLLFKNDTIPENKKQERLISSPVFLNLLDKLKKDKMFSKSVDLIKGNLKIN